MISKTTLLKFFSEVHFQSLKLQTTQSIQKWNGLLKQWQGSITSEFYTLNIEKIKQKWYVFGSFYCQKYLGDF